MTRVRTITAALIAVAIVGVLMRQFNDRPPAELFVRTDESSVDTEAGTTRDRVRCQEPDSRNLVTLRIEDGSVISRVELPVDSQRIYQPQSHAVYQIGTELRVYDVDGRLRWAAATSASPNGTWAFNDTLYLTGPAGTAAVDLVSGEAIWRADEGGDRLFVESTSVVVQQGTRRNAPGFGVVVLDSTDGAIEASYEGQRAR